MAKKTTNIIYKQNPVCNDFNILSELKDVLNSGFNESVLGYDHVGLFVDEVTRTEDRMKFFFKNTRKKLFRQRKKRTI